MLLLTEVQFLICCQQGNRVVEDSSALVVANRQVLSELSASVSTFDLLLIVALLALISNVHEFKD